MKKCLSLKEVINFTARLRLPYIPAPVVVDFIANSEAEGRKEIERNWPKAEEVEICRTKTP